MADEIRDDADETGRSDEDVIGTEDEFDEGDDVEDQDEEEDGEEDAEEDKEV